MRIKTLISMFILALSFSASATLVVRENVQFERNNWRLNGEQLERLRAFVAQSEGYIIEKIDVEGHCDHVGSEYFNMELSRKRAISVYDVLTSVVPDQGDYEVRFVGERHPVSLFEDDQNRCVMVVMYLLEPNVQVVSAPIERALFPEEFPFALVAEKKAEETPVIVQSKPEVKSKGEAPKSVNIPEDFRDKGRFSIENVHFHGNSCVVRSDSDESLQELADFMNYYDDVRIRIDGHVNGKMGKGYLKKAARSNPERRQYKSGRELSLARAETVRDFLISEGVDESRIVCEGKGGTEMLYKKPKTQKENQANRRIEVIILNN